MTISTISRPALSLLLGLAFYCLSGASQARIIDLQTREEMTEDQLAERLRSRDVVLLGELHDNPSHHAIRGRLIARIAGPQTTVVAEHLPVGAKLAPGGSLLNDLEAAGFHAEGWGWPLHEPLFSGVRQAGAPLVGGNLPRGFSRQLMQQGEGALDDPMADAYSRSPLSPDAARRLDDDLVSGHCGKLPTKYLAPMHLVQRATDVSMARALLAHRPSLLVAGNGHVRKDYGVPQVLGALAPSLKISAVGFYEKDSDAPELLQSLASRYDYLWLTDGAERTDPCENFQIK